MLTLNKEMLAGIALKPDLKSDKVFAKLKFSPVLFKKIPLFLCLVFKNQNKWILKL